MVLFENAVIHGGNALVAVIDGTQQARCWATATIKRFRPLSDVNNGNVSVQDARRARLPVGPPVGHEDAPGVLLRPLSKDVAASHLYGARRYDPALCACEIRQYGTGMLRQCRRVPGYGPEGLFCAQHAAATTR